MNLPHLIAPKADPRAGAEAGPLERAFAALREQLDLTLDYPQAAEAEAEQAARTVALPGRDGRAVLHHRPVRVDGPGPGDVPGAGR